MLADSFSIYKALFTFHIDYLICNFSISSFILEILFKKKNFLFKIKAVAYSVPVFLSYMFHQGIVSLLALSSLMYSYNIPRGKWK